jgi:leader peptidase (prepilin peptidase)/N-methyltransferase
MIVLAALIFVCWGSFLNMLAWRLINGNLAASRSFCPHCKHTLAWYDLIPVISYFTLLGRCRYCKKSISPLYPIIELITMASMTALWISTPMPLFLYYFIFFSALIVTVRTDTQYMLISRFATLFLLPIPFIATMHRALPISLIESLIGALLGYGFLWIIATIFYLRTGKQGMGQGDFELMALIGAFLGPIGCWLTLLGASITGSLIGIMLIALGATSSETKIPFGSFLSLAALIVTLALPQLTLLFFC